MAKLTPKQDAFVKAYLLNGGNATQAAISAGYSEKTAYSIGEENLRKPDIKKAIDEHQKKTQKDFIWSKEKKLELLQRIVNVAATEDGEKGMINMQSAIAAIKEHNLMQGDNAPVESNTNIKVDKPLAEMITGGSKR
jgi:phage terminase small subunit